MFKILSGPFQISGIPHIPLVAVFEMLDLESLEVFVRDLGTVKAVEEVVTSYEKSLGLGVNPCQHQGLDRVALLKRMGDLRIIIDNPDHGLRAPFTRAQLVMTCLEKRLSETPMQTEVMGRLLAKVQSTGNAYDASLFRMMKVFIGRQNNPLADEKLNVLDVLVSKINHDRTRDLISSAIERKQRCLILTYRDETVPADIPLLDGFVESG